MRCAGVLERREAVEEGGQVGEGGEDAGAGVGQGGGGWREGQGGELVRCVGLDGADCGYRSSRRSSLSCERLYTKLLYVLHLPLRTAS